MKDPIQEFSEADTERIEEQLHYLNKARKEKDYKTEKCILKSLASHGILIRDTPHGIRWSHRITSKKNNSRSNVEDRELHDSIFSAINLYHKRHLAEHHTPHRHDTYTGHMDFPNLTSTELMEDSYEGRSDVGSPISRVEALNMSKRILDKAEKERNPDQCGHWCHKHGNPHDKIDGQWMPWKVCPMGCSQPLWAPFTKKKEDQDELWKIV